MNDFSPVNLVKVSHRAVQTSRDGLVVYSKCVDCGLVFETLDLDSFVESKHNDIHEYTFSMLAEPLYRYRKAIVDETEYDSIKDLISDIVKTNQDIKTSDAGEIPLGQLEIWAKKKNNKNYRRFRRRALLEYLQGPVCNRCDQIFHLSRLSIDHINGNRDIGELSNLQLLCEECHKEKNREGNDPGARDVSPLKYSGEQRVHTISCVEPAKTERLQPLKRNRL